MRGQASLEYVAAVALLACVMAGAGTAVAAPDLRGAVVARLRLALCVVGGDVCSDEDAAERGLEPCLVAGSEHARSTGISFLFLRGGGTDFWSVQRRSDGQVRLTVGYGQSLDAGTGIGAQLGPAAVGGRATAGAGFRSGSTWLVDEARLRALLAGTGGDPTRARMVLEVALGEPAERYVEGGGAGAAQLAFEAVRELPAGGAEARAVLGRRTGPGGTAYYVDLGAGSAGPIADALPGVDLRGRVVAEYLDGSPPAITLRAVGRRGAGEEIETVLRLPLRTPADAAAARRLAFLAPVDPAAALADLGARVRARGTVERLRYRVRVDERGWAYGLDLGLRLGADRSASVLSRELVGAQVLNGPFPARREDCLHFAAAAAGTVGSPR